MANTVKKTFLSNASWTSPPRISLIRVEALKFNTEQINMADASLDATIGNVGYNFLDTFGNGWGIGNNSGGLLGTGTTTAAFSSPVAVISGFTFARVYGGQSSNFGITTQGKCWGWGGNANGQLGLGDVTPRSSPIAVLGGTNFRKVIPLNSAFVGSVAFLTESGIAYGSGVNTNGQLGVGDVTPRSSPVAVLGGLRFATVIPSSNAQFYGLTSAGALYAWGVNTNGELGVGDVTPRSSPVAVLGGHVFTQLASVNSAAAIALDLDGNSWAWGFQSASAPYGVGDLIPHSSPIAVLGGLKFVKVYSFANSYFGLQADGTVYAWGLNTTGQLGLGDVTPRSSPVAVLGGHKFRMLAGEIASVSTIFGITLDNDLYAWGAGSLGQLGNGGSLAVSSPILVLGGMKWAWVWPNGPIGVTVDGDLYGWGANSFGQLGLGDIVPRSSPVAILGGHRMIASFQVASKIIRVTPNTSYTISMNDQFVKFGNEVLIPENNLSWGANGADYVNIYYDV